MTQLHLLNASVVINVIQPLPRMKPFLVTPSKVFNRQATSESHSCKARPAFISLPGPRLRARAVRFPQRIVEARGVTPTAGAATNASGHGTSVVSTNNHKRETIGSKYREMRFYNKSTEAEQGKASQGKSLFRLWERFPHGDPGVRMRPREANPEL